MQLQTLTYSIQIKLIETFAAGFYAKGECIHRSRASITITFTLLLFLFRSFTVHTVYMPNTHPICKTTIYFYQWQNNTVPNIMHKLNGIRLIVFTVAQALKYARGVCIYRLHFNLDSVVIAWIDASVMIENPLFGDFGRFLDLYMQFFSRKTRTKEHPLPIAYWINRNWMKWIRILSMFSVLDIGLLKRFEISIGQRNNFSINPIGGIHYWNAFEVPKANWIVLYDLFHH